MYQRVCMATVGRCGRFCFLLLMAVLLGACGQKGALYMPAQTANVQAPSLQTPNQNQTDVLALSPKTSKPLLKESQ